jgi:hypothetical protein
LLRSVIGVKLHVCYDIPTDALEKEEEEKSQRPNIDQTMQLSIEILNGPNHHKWPVKHFMELSKLFNDQQIFIISHGESR